MTKKNQAAEAAAPAAAPAPATETAADQLPPAVDKAGAPPASNPPHVESELRKVLLLVDCAFGKCAQVVELAIHEAEALIKGGHADDHPAAIAAHDTAASATASDDAIED